MWYGINTIGTDQIRVAVYLLIDTLCWGLRAPFFLPVMYKEQLESAQCAGEHQADSVYLGTYYSASLHPCLPTTPPNLEDHYSIFIWAS